MHFVFNDCNRFLACNICESRGGATPKSDEKRKMETEDWTQDLNKIQKFEDLNVWKESVKLSVNIYKVLKNCKDFGLRDQIQRSAVSIPSNISEGFDRKGNKEFIQFLYIAKGSCSELRTQLYIALETGTIDKSIGKDFIDKSKMISAMLYKLIQVRKEKF